MNGLQKNALRALKKNYCRILLINRKLDSYFPIVIEENESEWNTIGKLSDFTNWFCENGNIYEADKPIFKRYVQECLLNGETKDLFYRRRVGDEYHWAYIFIEQSEKTNEEFLYVRDCNDAYINQCDLIVDSVGGVDALTGLGNKLAFEAYSAMHTDEAITVRIDNLEAMNVELGYKETDNFIVNVANIISEYCCNAFRLHGGVFKLMVDEELAKNMDALQKRLVGIATIS